MELKNVCLKKETVSDAHGMAHRIAELLSSKKAERIEIIDISAATPIADYFVICSARSTTAVKSLTDYVDEKLSADGIEPKGRDIDAKWAAVDYGSVIMHVFHVETREFYSLERLWDTGNNTEHIA